MDLKSLKEKMLGTWSSIATEIRPSATKTNERTLKPFYLVREFSCHPDDRFELTIVNSSDASGKVPLAKIFVEGHIQWHGAHSVAEGAQKVNFVADIDYLVTPLSQGFADILNQVAAEGYAPWSIGTMQKVFGKNFLPFGLVEGKNFVEFDLVYLRHDLLFWGARHVDGRGFDTEVNRPTNLQIPLVRI